MVITVAVAHAFTTPATQHRHLTLVGRRPRHVRDDAHAAAILERAEAGDRSVLPRWGINSPIRDHGAEPGAYTGTTGWTSRDHWLAFTVPAALAARPEILASHHVSTDTFRRWCRHKSLYAQQERSGRTVIVRPKTLANLMRCSLSTVHRCQRVARQLGLELVVIPGRMLSEIECYAARKAGSPQRGLATVSAFVVPSWLPRLVGYDTPTRGTQLNISVTKSSTINNGRAGWKRAPLRSARHQRKRSPAYPLADGLVSRVIFLRGCPPGRLTGQLQRFHAAPKVWSVERLVRAMDDVNARLGYTAPVRPKQAPWGLLAWYLKQIDPVADHPDYAGSFPESNT